MASEKEVCVTKMKIFLKFLWKLRLKSAKCDEVMNQFGQILDYSESRILKILTVIIHNHIESVGGLANVQISKKLLMSSAGASQKYLSHLEEQKRIKVSQEKCEKESQ